MERSTILFVDDDLIDRQTLRRRLAPRFQLAEAATCAAAQEQFEAVRPDAAVLDYQLPDGDALTLLERLRATDPGLPAILLTGHGSIELAVEAMRHGADHFLTKPADPEALVAILDRCISSRRRQRRERARAAQRETLKPDPFRGVSEAVHELSKSARKVAAAAGRPVLLVGETGSGKGLLARWLHDHSPRADEPFVELNCAGLKPELLENELFGHQKGAFTGADETKQGLLEIADRGTLFLDEIADMELGVQAKLLKVLEEQTFRRLGGLSDRRIDVRLVAATHQPLIRLVRAKLFRRDLYFRLNTLTLEIPPLRDRWEDVSHLADYFLERLGREFGRPQLELSAEAMEALSSHRWSGNIRELRNVLERAVLLGEDDALTPADLHFDTLRAGGPLGKDTASITLSELERLHIRDVLERQRGSVSRAAKTLGISRSTLYEKIKKYGLKIRNH